MDTFLYPYKDGSASAKALSQALGIKRIRRTGSRFSPSNKKTVINWGSSVFPFDEGLCNTLNKPHLVSLSTNKLGFFVDQQNNGNEELVVSWTTDGAVVSQWLGEGKVVVARTKLTGHSGEGIVLLEGADAEIIDAPLYTLYVPKKDEYRAHVYRRKDGTTEVFDIQRKAKRNDVAKEEANYRIRNLAGGFIYARQELNVPECVEDVALKVFEQAGLDFGAVDIIYQDRQNRAYALEINTAPGLSGTTLDKYVQMFKEALS